MDCEDAVYLSLKVKLVGQSDRLFQTKAEDGVTGFCRNPQVFNLKPVQCKTLPCKVLKLL